MKVKFENIRVESSKDFTSESFEIGDTRVIMEILRGKIYSDPIHIICQEIMSNARDAHREVGKDNVPIEVHIPNSLDKSLHIRDYGPGIDPKRMSEIFLKYGNSTKRGDDIQTGGYGLGAKTPFAYSDTFTIITVCPDEDNPAKFIRRDYIAHIDETGYGAVSIVREEETDDSQGTTIIVPVKDPDSYQFKMSVEKVSRNWDVRPKVFPEGELTWIEPEFICRESDWALEKAGQSYGGNNAKAVVDGIEYDIDGSHFSSHLLRYKFLLYFDVGDVAITATREKLDYHKKTKKAIRDRLKKIKQELNGVIEKALENCPNLWEAMVFYQGIQRGLPEVTPVWRGTEFKIDGRINLVNLANIARYNYLDMGVRKNRNNYSSIYVASDKVLIENDTDKAPNRLALAKFFEDRKKEGKEVHEIVLVKFRDNVEKPDYWKYLEVLKLSELEIPKKTKGGAGRGNAGVYSPRIPIREVVPNFDKSDWKASSEDPSTGSGIYVTLYQNQVFLDSECKRRLYKDDLIDLAKFLNVKLKSVLKSTIKSLGSGWKSAEQELLDRIKKLRSKHRIFRGTKGYDHKFDPDSRLDRTVSSAIYHAEIDKKLPKRSYAVKYRNLNKKYQKDTKVLAQLNRLLDALGADPQEPNNSFYEKAWEKFIERYPLLMHCTERSYYSSDIPKSNFSESVIDYIRMRDKELRDD